VPAAGLYRRARRNGLCTSPALGTTGDTGGRAYVPPTRPKDRLDAAKPGNGKAAKRRAKARSRQVPRRRQAKGIKAAKAKDRQVEERQAKDGQSRRRR